MFFFSFPDVRFEGMCLFFVASAEFSSIQDGFRANDQQHGQWFALVGSKFLAVERKHEATIKASLLIWLFDRCFKWLTCLSGASNRSNRSDRLGTGNAGWRTLADRCWNRIESFSCCRPFRETWKLHLPYSPITNQSHPLSDTALCLTIFAPALCTAFRPLFTVVLGS